VSDLVSRDMMERVVKRANEIACLHTPSAQERTIGDWHESPMIRALICAILEEAIRVVKHDVANVQQLVQSQNDVVRLASANQKNDVARLERLIEGMQVK